MLSSCTRSGGGAAATDGYETTLNIILASDGKLEHGFAVHESVTSLSAMKAALVKPGGHCNDLPLEPQRSPPSHGVTRVVMLGSRGETGGRRPYQKNNLDAMPAP